MICWWGWANLEPQQRKHSLGADCAEWDALAVDPDQDDDFADADQDALTDVAGDDVEQDAVADDEDQNDAASCDNDVCVVIGWPSEYQKKMACSIIRRSSALAGCSGLIIADLLLLLAMTTFATRKALKALAICSGLIITNLLPVFTQFD